MLPTILLGHPASSASDDPPEMEFSRAEIHPIAACVFDLNFEVFETSEALIAELFGFVDGDVMFLDAGSAPVFRMFEDACRKIVDGEITQFDLARLQASEAKHHIILDYGEHGRLEPEVVVGAKRFLGFLAANPDYWPPRFGDTSERRG